jgi:hypothetical protein
MNGSYRLLVRNHRNRSCAFQHFFHDNAQLQTRQRCIARIHGGGRDQSRSLLRLLDLDMWTALVVRKRFGASPELSRARVLLHAIFGVQFLLGFGTYWLAPCCFAFSVLIVLICYRIVPRGREVAAAAPRQVAVE